MRELKGYIRHAAVSLCKARKHQADEYACADCRADIVRLVDAPAPVAAGEAVAWDSEWWLVLVGEGDEPEVFIFEDDARTWARQLDAENPDGAPHVVVRVVRPLATPTPPVSAPPSEERWEIVPWYPQGFAAQLRKALATSGSGPVVLDRITVESLALMIETHPTPPSAAVRGEDIEWLEYALERARHDETQEWVIDDEPMVLRQRLERILAALTSRTEKDNA